MHFPKLTPLQSRLAACLGSSIILVIIYYSISPSHFAYAAELDSILNEDHNHHRIGPGHDLDLATDIDWNDGVDILETDGFAGTGEYQAEFPGVVRELVGRAPPGTAQLKNNVPNPQINIAAGDSDDYEFSSTEIYGASGTARTGLPSPIARSDGTFIQKRADAGRNEDLGAEIHELLKRQGTNGTSKLVYISVNTCLQPLVNSGRTGTPPQLTLYVSQNQSTQSPSANKNADKYPLDQGYLSKAINVTGSVWFSVVADDLTDDFSGQWSYSIAASIDASYYYWEDNPYPFIWTVDTDSKSALLATTNLTDTDTNVSNDTIKLRQEWMNMTHPPPFTMKIYNTSYSNITGLEKSYCAWKTLGPNDIALNYTMTQRGVGQNPKQQFYATGLQPGQNYTAVVAYDGVNMTNENVVAGGGQLWKSITFTTKSEENCKIIYDLPFCDAVAYAVPTNPTNESLTVQELKRTYDDYASALFKNFTNSLDQIQCHTAESAQYSLATNCDACSANYKLWLCAVTIPRCEDFSSTNSALQPRNVGHAFSNGTVPMFTVPNHTEIQAPSRLLYNSSRNPMIDQLIKPGPYKELLPCQELCFDLVQACPTALQFMCPRAIGYAGGVLSDSYGTYDPSKVSPNDFVTCNFLGVDWPSLSDGRRLGMSSVGWSLVVGVMLLLLWN